MKKANVILRAGMLRVGIILLSGTLFGALCGCGHNPNHDIDPKRAREAADRVHAPPDPGVEMKPGHGG